MLTEEKMYDRYMQQLENNVAQQKSEIAALRAENAKLRGTLNNLLTNCELGHWSKYVREVLAQTADNL